LYFYNSTYFDALTKFLDRVVKRVFYDIPCDIAVGTLYVEYKIKSYMPLFFFLRFHCAATTLTNPLTPPTGVKLLAILSRFLTLTLLTTPPPTHPPSQTHKTTCFSDFYIKPEERKLYRVLYTRKEYFVVRGNNNMYSYNFGRNFFTSKSRIILHSIRGRRVARCRMNFHLKSISRASSSAVQLPSAVTRILLRFHRYKVNRYLPPPPN